MVGGEVVSRGVELEDGKGRVPGWMMLGGGGEQFFCFSLL